VTLEFVQAMLAAFKDEQLIHRRYAFEIILKVLLWLVSLAYSFARLVCVTVTVHAASA
jgi:hypothetical protein